MRVLLYNWVPFDDAERRGGGIRVYQNGLVRELIDRGHDVATVSSGLEHDRLDPRIRVEERRDAGPRRVRSFRVVNSPVLAPGQHCFGSDQLFTTGPALAAWHEFLRRQGPWDVIQFDSLEGIPFTFLRVHEVLPDTRVLLYAHNHYAVCPQVNLWKDEQQACDDYDGGRDCVTCLPDAVDQGEVRRAHQLSRVLRSAGVAPGTRGYHGAYSAWARLKRHDRAATTVTRSVTSTLAALQRARAALVPGMEAARSWMADLRPGSEAPDPAPARTGSTAPTGPGSEDPWPRSPADGPAAGVNGVSGSRVAQPPRNGRTACSSSTGPGTNGHAATDAATLGTALGRAPRTPATLPMAQPLHAHERYRRRRVDATALVNTEVDTVLATSRRTAEVWAARGIDPSRIRVTYIGSRVADRARHRPRRTRLREPGIVTAAFLGYMRRDKGFHHLVEALERAPIPRRRRIRLVVAARADDPEAFARLSAIAGSTAGVWHVDGYGHEDLPAILDRVDVGIVPVQWEDNLPQVALEMAAHGIPVVTSDRGGARELGGNHPDWTFPAEDHAALVDRLVAIADGDVALASYWQTARPPRGMGDHVDELIDVYRGERLQERSAMEAR